MFKSKNIQKSQICPQFRLRYRRYVVFLISYKNHRHEICHIQLIYDENLRGCFRGKQSPLKNTHNSNLKSSILCYLRSLMNKELETKPGGRQVVLSGVRPTGNLHLGNYFGALRNYVKMQEEYECYFFIADQHSLTTHPDTKELRENVLHVVSEYIASGLDPQKVALYCQSDLHETAELYLYLNMMAYKGELEKTTTFKDKVRQQPDNVNAGLLTYPVLMASDILIHRAALVPVGKDQEQHLEMTRNFAQRFNHRYGMVFPEPKAFNFGSELLKVPSLDGAGKMSKSENQNATIYLADDDDMLRKKIMKAKTDQGPTEPNSPKPDYIVNIFDLMKLVSQQEVIDKFEADYNNCNIRYGDMKKQLAEDMVAYITPIRQKAKDIRENESYLKKVLAGGAAKANVNANKTMQLVREAMGLKYF